MSKEDEIEHHIQRNALAIDELSIRIQSLNQEVDELLEELKVSSGQLSAFLANKEHFTEDNWKVLEEQRHTLEVKLLGELANVRNPLKTKKSFQERHVQPHWLYVR